MPLPPFAFTYIRNILSTHYLTQKWKSEKKVRFREAACMHLFVSISTFFKTFRINNSTKGCLKSEEKVGNTFVVIKQLQPIKIMRQHFIALFFSPLCNWPINRRKCTNIHMHSSKFQDLCSMKSSGEMLQILPYTYLE